MESRNPKLKKIFDDIVNGDRPLDGPLIPHFIKSISTHPDPAACLHALVTSEDRLEAVQTAVYSNLSAESLTAVWRSSSLTYVIQNSNTSGAEIPYSGSYEHS